MHKRPSQHWRQVKTRHGRRPVLINKGIKKIPTVTRQERKILTHISNPSEQKVEYGGALDFNKKGKLENMQVIPGKTYEVSLPQDYEVLYHTHPTARVDPPTPEDIMALLSSKKQQAEIVFRKGEAFTIIKTRRTKALEQMSEGNLKRKLDKLFVGSMGKGWENNFKRELEKIGFYVSINKKPNSALKIPIKPKEAR